MKKTLIIARKELLSTFRQRNLMLIMFLSPIVLVAIMGLAFGGMGSSSGAPDFADIDVAVVNLDTGFNLQQQLPVSATNASLFNLGGLLQQDQNLNLQSGALNPENVSFNFGNQVASILLSQPLTTTGFISGSFNASSSGGFDLNELSCPFFPADEGANVEDENGVDGSLDELFDAVAVSDADVARAGVMRGDYAAAVIIPPDFSKQLAPKFGMNVTDATTPTAAIEVFANNGTPISASIVRAVVEGIVSQYERVSVALDALALTIIDRVPALDPNSLDPNSLDPDSLDLNALVPSVFDIGLSRSALQTTDASILAPLACLIMPGASNVQVEQQPLDAVQERSTFSILMVVLGGAQAVFFALFTGVFGINAIYEDRQQGTLQRVLVSPTSSTSVLAGRLLGNLVVVMVQLLVLLLAFTTIASLVEQKAIFIWGSNPLALLLVVLGLSLFASGLGVLIVGLAKTSEQVQLIGPMITLFLGGLSGIFGNSVPSQFAQFSPIWWGLEAMRKLSASESDIGLHLLVLFGVGILLASVGTFFFRRRMDI